MKAIFLLVLILPLLSPTKAADRRTCLADAKIQIEAINFEIKRLEAIALSPLGPRSTHGSCTIRLDRIDGNMLAAYPPSADEARVFNQISCLQLKKLYLRRNCACQGESLEFSFDERTIDQSLDAMSRLSRAQKEIRRRSILNPLIQRIVEEASEVRDCYSARTIAILNGAAAALERAME